MKTTGIIAAGILAGATWAGADLIYTYGWEDGGTILGFYGNVSGVLNVSVGSDPGTNDQTPSYDPALTVSPHGGSYMLELREDPHSSTPQAYVAYVEGLSLGDTVTVSFWGWDSTDSASPSLRIWGHWASNGDVNSYVTSAGGNNDYTVGVTDGQWSQVAYSWLNDASYEALVIEVRLYSTPSTGANSTPYWIDDLEIMAPDHATVTLPVPEAATAGLLMAGLPLAAAALRRNRWRADPELS